MSEGGGEGISENGASVNFDPLGGGASGELAVLPGRAPPVQAGVLQSHGEVEQHAHERNAGVERRGEDVVVPLPPPLAVAEDEEVEHRSHRHPGGVVEGGGGGHVGRRAQQHGQVDELDPTLTGELLVEEPHDHRAQGSPEEEPVEGAVVP